MTIAIAENVQTAPLLTPAKPTTLEATGVAADVLAELLIKMLHGGEASGMGLADRACLPYNILEPLLERLRVDMLVEVKSALGTGSAGYRYALTDKGRALALRCFDSCGYVGPAPVPLVQYTLHMNRLRAQTHDIYRERVASGFSHLIVEPEMLDQLGPAIASRKAMFLYGPPGNGKSVMGEGIGRILGGDIYIPYAIDVDGQIITMFDPVTHEARAEDDEHSVIRSNDAVDRRWVRVSRPVITVGGELTLEMLDLTFNPISRFYEAPIQMKANGGVFVVDDFGRQRIPPRDLLNRWIVPLESRVDYLTLHTGRKFELPFNVFIIFATNLQPESLADEAFLRRIPYKIRALNPTLDEYRRIFEMNCRRRGLAFDPETIDYLQRAYYQPRKLEMRACHPRDLIEQVVDRCRYHQRPPELTHALIDQACETYFIEETASQGNEA